VTIALSTGYEPGAVLYLFISVSQPILGHNHYYHRRRQPPQFSNITTVVTNYYNFPILLSSSPIITIVMWPAKPRRSVCAAPGAAVT